MFFLSQFCMQNRWKILSLVPVLILPYLNFTGHSPLLRLSGSNNKFSQLLQCCWTSSPEFLPLSGQRYKSGILDALLAPLLAPSLSLRPPSPALPSPSSGDADSCLPDKDALSRDGGGEGGCWRWLWRWKGYLFPGAGRGSRRERRPGARSRWRCAFNSRDITTAACPAPLPPELQ